MIEFGRINTLTLRARDAQGAWFEGDQIRILLPANEVPADAARGQKLAVFVYLNAEGLPLATLKHPKAQVGEFALLQVGQVTKHGAFLDWGLDKQLLVPFSEQPERMRAGRRYLVKVCMDDRGRLVATARIERCLEEGPGGLQIGDEVDVILWDFTDLGAKVIINDLYPGLLYQDEIRSGVKRGQRFKAYVRHIRDDGKIDVTLRRGGAAGARDDREVLLQALEKNGHLPLHDQSSPEDIRLALGLSKKAFKKAVGGLYKEGLVTLETDGIRLAGKPPRGRGAKKPGGK
ncbi:CvfB family protein [Geoalkalibacter halelectricus]|uniref:S1-like domain-containing RNA-binding protein n=1 Tax=Geoalkalibacter halelectricus TaxID=2847045 RepID=A0ABY5ZN08_9BACT|nr:S1-like domain-containing RNA-binding protein [Geoalkalibacter halelectricus]MDO3377323.1 S1-like domain-containing RNA-binding protein [Geoalkalibacter halelectricus]UWZ79195.1 S1-like domain-containing RNA-binding protein [Geoalkalibacter halelectricus]